MIGPSSFGYEQPDKQLEQVAAHTGETHSLANACYTVQFLVEQI